MNRNMGEYMDFEIGSGGDVSVPESGWEQIIVTADGSTKEEENGRLFRLYRLSGFLEATVSKDTLDKIRELSDHEGCLTVVWSEQPSDMEKSRINAGWEHCGESQVEHQDEEYHDVGL